jgi:tripartite-type tricarboxylate transporter receptor subunit TctC
MYSMLKTPEAKQLADAVFRMVELARPFAAPSGTPPDRVEALRKAMLETMADPAMVADAKRLAIDFDPVPGDETAQVFSDYYSLPPALLEQARQYTQPDPK